MANGYNQNWGTEEMVRFIGHTIDTAEQRCGWMCNGTACNISVRRQDFGAHLRAHHVIDANAILHLCQWHGCNPNWMTMAALESHVKEQHTSARWACPKCLGICTSERNLRAHLCMSR